MNYQKAFIIPCTKHESKKIGFVCTKPGCKERFICAQCYKGHPDNHKENFISIMEIFAEDFSSEYQELTAIIVKSNEEASNAINDLDIQFDQIKEDLNSALEDLRIEYRQNVQKMTFDEQGVKLKCHYDKISDFLEMPEDLVISSRVELADALSNFKEIKNEIRNIKVQPPVVYKNRNQQYDKLKKFISGLLTVQSKFTQGACFWKWDATKRSGHIVVNEDGMTASLPSGSGNHGIIADIVMTEGVYEWNIEHDPNIKDGFWGIGFGLISKKDIDSISDWESFPYNKALCRSTSGTVHNMTSIEKINLKGKIAKVKANFIEGKIQMFTDGKLMAEAELKKGVEYVPFLDFNHIGTAKLTFT